MAPVAVQENSRLVAIVDDDDLMRSALEGLLKQAGLPVRTFASAEDFLSSGQQHHTACLIADIRMPGMTGLDLHRHLSVSGKLIPTVLITAYPDDSVRERAVAAGVIGYLSKPFEEDDLLACIRSALTHDRSGGR